MNIIPVTFHKNSLEVLHSSPASVSSTIPTTKYTMLPVPNPKKNVFRTEQMTVRFLAFSRLKKFLIFLNMSQYLSCQLWRTLWPIDLHDDHLPSNDLLFQVQVSTPGIRSIPGNESQRITGMRENYLIKFLFSRRQTIILGMKL